MGEDGKQSGWKRIFCHSRCLCFGCSKCHVKADDNGENEDADSTDSFRRGGISYNKTEKKALYVRMLGDVKASTKQKHSSSLADMELLKKMNVCNTTPAVISRRSSLVDKSRHPSFQSPTTTDCSYMLDLHYTTQAMVLMVNIHEWDFNVFTLDQLTNELIESGYCQSNPYHNSLHAADVVQAMHCNLQEKNISGYLSPLEKMSAILSAACHDLDHPGVNQQFLAASSNHLVSLYHGRSVLENHHWHATISILHESHIFDHLDRPSCSDCFQKGTKASSVFEGLLWDRLKCLIETLILATDISRQHEILTTFKSHINNNSLDLKNNESHRNFILQITLKCSDICNPCRPWQLSQRWSELICEEFFRQGDKERKFGLPQHPPFNRSTSSTAKIQTGFMTAIVEPLFKEWNYFAPTKRSRTMLDNLVFNKKKWDEKLEEESGKRHVMTTVAITEKPRTSDVEVQDVQCCLNSDQCGNKENIDLLAMPERPGSLESRRHSLPVEPILDDLEKTLIDAVKQTDRRHSLPLNSTVKSCSNFVVQSTKLASLSECSPLANECSDFESLSKIRRCSYDENTDCSDKQMAIDHKSGCRRHSEFAPANRFCSKGCGDKRRASCPITAAKLLYQNGGSACVATRPPSKTSQLFIIANCKTSDCHRKCADKNGSRKLSLSNAEERRPSTLFCRKRARSLATSNLAGSENEGEQSWNGIAGPVAIPTNCNSSLSTVITCRAKKGDTKFGKQNIFSMQNNAKSLHSKALTNNTCYNSGNEPCGVRFSHPQHNQLLSSVPAITRFVDIHTRPPKGMSRKATAVFAAAQDGEVVPLLQRSADT